MSESMKKAFTLAEVLITLAIIGVVAALAIPSVISNAQQLEFKTGLRKAVSVLNSSIMMNQALEGTSPYDTDDLYKYLQQHMSVMRSMVRGPRYTEVGESNAARYFGNISFYTTDGMRFEFVQGTEVEKYILHETPGVHLREPIGPVYDNAAGDAETVSNYNTCPSGSDCAHCGSYGLNAFCFKADCSSQNIRRYADPKGVWLTDTFPIMITDKEAIPYGTAAQRAMYQGKN